MVQKNYVCMKRERENMDEERAIKNNKEYYL